jgi:hypothetical protein
LTRFKVGCFDVDEVEDRVFPDPITFFVGAMSVR